jgi:HK97 gp10 family phage protein
MAGSSAKLSGFAELRKSFNEMSLAAQGRRLDLAATAGGRVIRDKARQIAEAKGIRDTGLLIENIVHKRVRENNPFQAEAHIAVRSGGQTKRGKAKARKLFAKGDDAGGKKAIEEIRDPYYWKFVELGTSKMTARPFIAPALDQSKDEAIDAVRESMKRGIAAAARKQGLKYVG